MKIGSLIKGKNDYVLLWSGWFDMSDTVVGSLRSHELGIALEFITKKFDSQMKKGIKIQTSGGISGWCSFMDIKVVKQ